MFCFVSWRQFRAFLKMHNELLFIVHCLHNFINFFPTGYIFVKTVSILLVSWTWMVRIGTYLITDLSKIEGSIKMSFILMRQKLKGCETALLCSEIIFEKDFPFSSN